MPWLEGAHSVHAAVSQDRGGRVESGHRVQVQRRVVLVVGAGGRQGLGEQQPVGAGRRHQHLERAVPVSPPVLRQQAQQLGDALHALVERTPERRHVQQLRLAVGRGLRVHAPCCR